MVSINQRFSEETTYLQRSVMRDLIVRTAQPDIIPLSGGLPAGECLPVDALAECFQTVLKREGSSALQYRPRYGPLLEWIAGYMNARGVDCEPEQVFITNGNQQSLTILSRLFVDAHSVTVTEAITFTGIKQVTAGRGAEVRTVPTDLETGVDVDALEAAFGANPRPALCVLIPDFHNPLGVSITSDKRQQIARLAAQYGVPLVEDDPYSALRFIGQPAAPIKAYDDGNHVFYIGSFSKMLAPATRLGWMIAPLELISKITVFREAIDLESSALMQRAVAEFLNRGLLEPHLDQLIRVHHARYNVLQDALERNFAGIATWTRSEGGMFVWVTLHDETIDTWALLDDALAQKVAYIPGRAFAVDGGYQNTMRLNFSKVEPKLIEEGVRRLAQVIKGQ
jgi:2-aminoadipate transaminase